MERKYCFPNAFVIDYKEDYGDEEGIGTFTLVIKQAYRRKAKKYP